MQKLMKKGYKNAKVVMKATVKNAKRAAQQQEMD